MIRIGGLHVNQALYDFIQNDVLSRELEIDTSRFWSGLEGAVRILGPQNFSVLQKRDALQAQIDEWCSARKGQPIPVEEQRKFLESIGYIQKPPRNVKIIVNDVDPEIADVAGPQLVVPLTNARFAINAANARWGSLYDALYGSDVISDENGQQKNPGGEYNPHRGRAVIAYAMAFLDKSIPLVEGSYGDIDGMKLSSTSQGCQLVATRKGNNVGLKNPAQFVGYNGEISLNSGPAKGKTSLLFCHNNLHIEIIVDPVKSKREHPAHVVDVVVESAVSTIQDCEDSVAVVDAEDKILLYKNWLGLMNGDLTAEVPTAKGTIVRRLAADKEYTSSKTGERMTLPGRSLLLIRNTAHHVYTDIVTVAQTETPIPETFLDAFVTCLISLIDLQKKSKLSNSRTGSVYIVKPKLHGPQEVRLVNELFDLVEKTLRLPAYTVKLGIMDEERRTSLNLKSCIQEVHRRVIFVNTGFLDRTGDEIHTSFNLGPFCTKRQIKAAPWIKSYEMQNVTVGLSCGLLGRGQIGKGMWAEPDGMKAMVVQKISHPKAGASTAWVPSPTAASLHALHYHEVSVKDVQSELLRNVETAGEADYVNDLLAVPIMTDGSDLSRNEIQRELENNLQGLLGYVVRWVNHGVGCSKVPDINGVGLMEDRATLRISSQHVANWLKHGLVSEVQVFDCMRHMAAVVDRQNAGDPKYIPMESRPFSSFAFQAALDLVFQGDKTPNGYTEFILQKRRIQAKKAAKGEKIEEDSFLKPGVATWSRM